MSDNSHNTGCASLRGFPLFPLAIAPISRVLVYDYGLSVRVASTEGDLKNAWELVDRRYAWRGYTTAECERRAGRFVTLIAEWEGRTVGTVTVRADSESGLMVDGSYAREVDDYRRRGRFVCEATRLATLRQTGSQTDSRKPVAVLLHAAIVWARRLVATDLFVEINPRHERFYQWLSFAVATDHHTTCPRVQAPAVLMHLELAAAQPDRWLQLLGAGRSLPLAA